MTTYYHWHPELFKINVIIAGNYLNLLEQFDKISHSNKYELEMFFEEQRKLFFPAKPSRLNSIFLLNSLDDALLYKKHCEMKDCIPYKRILYSVEIIDNSKAIHNGCTSLFHQFWMEGLREKASHFYWNGEKSILSYPDGSKELMPREIIIESDVRVIEIISYLPILI